MRVNTLNKEGKIIFSKGTSPFSFFILEKMKTNPKQLLAKNLEFLFYFDAIAVREKF